MASQYPSDLVLYIRFFAAIAVVLGGLSSAWTAYISICYPTDFSAIMARLGFSVPLLLGGLAVRDMFPAKFHQSRTDRNNWTGMAKIDAVMQCLLLLAIFFNVIMLPTAIASHFNATAANTSFLPVEVRVESINLKHIPADAIAQETLLKDVFCVPDLYKDLWVACGQVTILAMDGKAIAPTNRRAIFTVPKRYRAMDRNIYVQHFKMDAIMDSSQFEVGKLYSGWVVRNGNGEVFFSRPSDKILRDIWICVATLLIPALYLAARFLAGLRASKEQVATFN